MVARRQAHGLRLAPRRPVHGALRAAHRRRRTLQDDLQRPRQLPAALVAGWRVDRLHLERRRHPAAQDDEVVGRRAAHRAHRRAALHAADGHGLRAHRRRRHRRRSGGACLPDGRRRQTLHAARFLRAAGGAEPPPVPHARPLHHARPGGPVQARSDARLRIRDCDHHGGHPPGVDQQRHGAPEAHGGLRRPRLAVGQQPRAHELRGQPAQHAREHADDGARRRHGHDEPAGGQQGQPRARLPALHARRVTASAVEGRLRDARRPGVPAAVLRPHLALQPEEQPRVAVRDGLRRHRHRQPVSVEHRHLPLREAAGRHRRLRAPVRRRRRSARRQPRHGEGVPGGCRARLAQLPRAVVAERR